MEKGFLASISSGEPGKRWTPMVLATLLFATVLLPAFVGLAFLARSESVRQVDRQINEDGVRTVSLLSLLQPELLREPTDQTLMRELQEADGELQTLMQDFEYLRHQARQDGDYAHFSGGDDDSDGPPDALVNCQLQHAEGRLAWTNLFATPALRGALPKGTDVINVVIESSPGFSLWILDTSAPEIRLSGRAAIATDRGVTIYEGKYTTRRTIRVREFVGPLVDNAGNPAGQVRLFLSAARIDEVKERFLGAVVLPMGLSALGGLVLTVLLTWAVMSRLSRKAEASA